MATMARQRDSVCSFCTPSRQQWGGGSVGLFRPLSTPDPSHPLMLHPQVWALKSYTKSVPLYVQTVRQVTVRQIKPFLDPGQVRAPASSSRVCGVRRG